VHDRLEVGVGEEVAELVLDVAVVDVDGNRAQLERGEHALEVLVAVVHPQTHVVARPDAARRERVGQPGRPLVELPIREADVAEHDRLALGHRVGDRFEQVGEVERDVVGGHRSRRT